jgi:hypothetical protein
MKYKYSFEKLILDKEILRKSLFVLKSNRTDTYEESVVVNVLADFVENSQRYYSHFKSYADLSDSLVEYIKTYNPNNYDKKYKSSMISSLDALLHDLNNIKIQIYSSGNIEDSIIFKDIDIRSCFNYEIEKIENTEVFLAENQLDIDNVNILLAGNNTNISIFNFEKLYEIFDYVIDFSDVINALLDTSIKVYDKNRRYNHLYYTLERCGREDVETIIVGNSYPMYAINPRDLDKTLTLASNSQDLYYSMKIAKDAIKRNKNIKRCIIGAGYYLVNHDLSMGTTGYSRKLMKNVYYPLFKDKHNAKHVEDYAINTLSLELKDNIFISNIFNLDYLDNYFKMFITIDRNGYFHEGLKRSGFMGVDPRVLSETEKQAEGLKRANQHNKLLKYENTYREYKELFNYLIKFLRDNNVRTNNYCISFNEILF